MNQMKNSNNNGYGKMDISMMPKFNPLKTLKTIFYLSMVVILIMGCTKNGAYNFDPGAAFPGFEGTHVTSFSKAFDISPMHGLFVWPISIVLTNVFNSTGNLFLTIIVATLVVRGSGTMLSLKATLQMEKMKEIQVKQGAIQAKYAGRTDPSAKQQMGAEMMALYKKEGVNPLGAFGAMFVSMPLFISLWRAISSTAVLQNGVTLFNLDVVETPMSAVREGKILFIIPLLVMIGAQYMSMRLPTILSNRRTTQKPSKQAQAQARKTANIMVIVMAFIGISLPLLIAIYWTFSAVYTSIQAIVIHKYFRNKNKVKRA